MSRSVIGLAAILLSLSQSAMADEYPLVAGPSTPGAMPQRISPQEVFQRLDANHDGFLSLNEFLAAPWIRNPKRATRLFHWMDANKDGLVSLQEFLAAYNSYCSRDGNSLQVAYPWAWICWQPWSCGWYWNNGWRGAAGDWWGRTHWRPRRDARNWNNGWRHRPGDRHGRAGRSHHVGRSHRHGKHVKHPGRGKHAKSPKARHRGRRGGHRRHAHRR